MRVELNITLKCNLSCTNCNRFCNLVKQEEHISIKTVKRFLENINTPIDRVKVVGGEPLLHPEFMLIFELLKNAVASGKIKKVKIDTNQMTPFPPNLWAKRTDAVRTGGTHPKKKKHYPMIHPVDIGYVTTAKYNCEMIRRCGFSLDNKGWLPCSSAIMIARLFNLEYLYKKQRPNTVWGLEELCQHCVFAMPQEWLNEHAYPVLNTPKEWRKPSKTYKKAIKEYVERINNESQEK